MKKNSFITGAMISTISIVAVKIMGMLYVIPFYAIVGDKGGALYSYAYQLYLLFLGISSAGIPNAISKVISEYNSTGKIEAKTRAFYLGKKILTYISIISFFLLFIFAEELATIYLGKIQGGNTPEDAAFVIRCVSFAILVIPHLSVTKGYLQGHKYIGPSSSANLIEQVVRIFVILAGSFLAYKVFNSTLSVAVGIAVSGAFFGGLFAYLYLKKKISNSKNELDLDKKLDKDEISNKAITKKIISYAIPFVVINVISNIYSITDSVLVLRTLTYLGYNGADVEFIASCISTWGTKISMIVNSIAMGMTVSLIPSIVEAYATKNTKDLNNKINKALQIIIFISLPMTIGLSILATPVWTIFYNTNPYGGSILRVMIFCALFGNLSMIISSSLQSMNKYKYVYFTNIFGTVLNAMLDVPLMILCNKIGLPAYYGANFASIIGYTLSILVGLKLINKDRKLSYKETVIVALKILVPISMMIILLILINSIININVFTKIGALIIIIIDTIIGGIMYMYITYKMGIIDYIFGSDYIKKIKKKLTHR